MELELVSELDRPWVFLNLWEEAVTGPPRGMGGMPSPPPGIAVPAQAGSALTEALRTLELPKLPAPGGEGASLQFGDWLTVVYPLMSDVSGSASEWWGPMAQAVENHYSHLLWKS